jgi:hypothetical protein
MEQCAGHGSYEELLGDDEGQLTGLLVANVRLDLEREQAPEQA